jgi:hypothetical protein
MPFVPAHALSMKALHGGQAKHDTIDAPKIAALLRGGMLPQADGYPAPMRATRDLWRRRTHLMRQRAELLAHVQKTHRPDHLPEIGQKLAANADRAGVAQRCAAPAVHQSLAVDFALITDDDQRLGDLDLSSVQAANRHDANTLDLWQTVPEIGKLLRLGRRDDIHDIARFPRGQEVVSDGRLVTCAKASAGKRLGTSGHQIGQAPLTWACPEAAVLVLRHNPTGRQYLARLANTHDKGKALTILAHTLARAVYDRRKRPPALDLDKFLHG